MPCLATGQTEQSSEMWKKKISLPASIHFNQLPSIFPESINFPVSSQHQSAACLITHQSASQHHGWFQGETWPGWNMLGTQFAINVFWRFRLLTSKVKSTQEPVFMSRTCLSWLSDCFLKLRCFMELPTTGQVLGLKSKVHPFHTSLTHSPWEPSAV